LEIIELNADIRSVTGKGPAGRLRAAGRVPAILYGAGIEPKMLTVDGKSLDQAIKKHTGAQLLLNLVIRNGAESRQTAILKEKQLHPVSRQLLHVDFYSIALDKKLLTKVRVHLTGKAKGVELGGVLQILQRELEIRCLPQDIPEALDVDVSDLDMGEAIHVSDIKLPESIEMVTAAEVPVVTVVSPKREDKVAEGAPEQAAEGESEA
jgi:large subunit ribosomal protein L25